jgi:predicted amidohydrolase YtcJ
MKAELLITDAHIVTMDRSRPYATTIAINKGRICAIGMQEELKLYCGKNTLIKSYKGKTILPGFIDAHIHFKSMINAARVLDCSYQKAASLSALMQLIKNAAISLPKGQWLTAYGYDEAMYPERCGPTREMIDHLVPDHPVVLRHQTGHEAVLNGMALQLIGWESEVHNGVVSGDVERISMIKPPGKNPIPDLLVAQCVNKLLSQGITSFQDATVTNGPSSLKQMLQWKEKGILPLRFRTFWGMNEISKYLQYADKFPIEVNGAKFIVEETMISSTLEKELLNDWIFLANRGISIAVHVVDVSSLVFILELFKKLKMKVNAGLSVKYRLEHVGLCPPGFAEEIAKLGLMVVTQPGFLYYRGSKYVRQIESDLYSWLYPVGELHSKGVMVAGSSDAPISPPNMFQHMVAINERITNNGIRLGEGPRLKLIEILRIFTYNAAYATGLSYMGALSLGKRADMIVLDRNPLDTPLSEWVQIQVLQTYVDGKVCYMKEDVPAYGC